jgi:DNA-binding MarR family transcriptional regulator
MFPEAKTDHPVEEKTPPLPTLLSQLLIAYTIEFDNEAERRIQHWTTALRGARPRSGVWLVSMAMWSNCMRLVPEEGIPVGELARRARTESLQLRGMERWGYIRVAPDPADTRTKPPQRDWLVRATLKGKVAQGIWRALLPEIEERWRTRFGGGEIDLLRNSLSAILRQIDLELPDYLPICGYGLFSQIPLEERPEAAADSEAAPTGLPLPTLLAKVLLCFAIEFEFDWKVSLAVSANVLRILGEKGVRVADLPRLSGLSKEAVAFATGWLERTQHAVLEPDPKAGKGKAIRLTAKGKAAKRAYSERLATIENRWLERFGAAQIAALRDSLLGILHKKDGEEWLLGQAMMPSPEGWRARPPYLARTLAFVADPAGSLPHFPMVLHRGGYPDGS